jgi:leucine dehydrogenase
LKAKKEESNVSVSSAPRIGVESAHADFDIFSEASQHGFGELYFKHDAASGLNAVVAVHNTQLGPGFGGTRCRSYPDSASAVRDAMRLAEGMSYKSAIARLPWGGGKAVISHTGEIRDREALFEAYGEFLESLGGRFVTAVDSGTGVADMDIIARRTRHVTSTSDPEAPGHGDPSPYTALGVCRSIEAAVRFRLDRSGIEDVHVAIQGVGHVGYYLARELHSRGARLSITDLDNNVVQRCVDEFGANRVSPERILSIACDVFAPCALGGVLNDETVQLLQAGIVCGAANNQLEAAEHGDRLAQRGVLYTPDYVVNAGGLMHAVPGSKEQLEERVWGIHDTLMDILEESAMENRPPHRVADDVARRILAGGAQ